MIKKLDIYIFSSLLISYFIINDNHLFFFFIYLILLLYYIYMVYKYIKFELKNNNEVIKFVGNSIFHFLFSYFIIYEPNPVYYLFTFYFPFADFFKALFIIMFHSYSLSKYEIKNIDEPNQIINTFDLNNNVEILNHENLANYEISYFFSDVIYFFKNNKKKLFQSICFLIIIKLILFYYYSKFWIFFKSKEKTLPISTTKNIQYYITACVLNMEPIIVDYIKEMKKLINYLGEKNIIVSIVENGDSKDNTRQYLKEFKKYLDYKLITNKFVLNHEIEDPRKKENLTKEEIAYGRIQYLVTLRNKCFELLYQIPNLEFEKIKIINFNDIVFSYEDIIKLISTNNEDYDVVCAMDYYFNFYDSWVSIDLDGNHLLGNFPYFINKEGQDQYINKKPIRIFSCWNGVIAFNASFFKNKKMNFRVENLSNNANGEKCDCNNDEIAVYESECTYFNIDMETLGFTKRFINPEVKVAYNYKCYYFSKYILPNTFELIFYFINYFRSFFTKRNKDMSNLKSNNISYIKKLKNWYNCKKIKF